MTRPTARQFYGCIEYSIEVVPGLLRIGLMDVLDAKVFAHQLDVAIREAELCNRGVASV